MECVSHKRKSLRPAEFTSCLSAHHFGSLPLSTLFPQASCHRLQQCYWLEAAPHPFPRGLLHPLKRIGISVSWHFFYDNFQSQQVLLNVYSLLLHLIDHAFTEKSEDFCLFCSKSKMEQKWVLKCDIRFWNHAAGRNLLSLNKGAF